MVGHLVLVQRIGVQIPVSEHRKTKLILALFFTRGTGIRIFAIINL